MKKNKFLVWVLILCLILLGVVMFMPTSVEADGPFPTAETMLTPTGSVGPKPTWTARPTMVQVFTKEFTPTPVVMPSETPQIVKVETLTATPNRQTVPSYTPTIGRTTILTHTPSATVTETSTATIPNMVEEEVKQATRTPAPYSTGGNASSKGLYFSMLVVAGLIALYAIFHGWLSRILGK